MTNWAPRLIFYKHFRSLWPFGWILRRETARIVALLPTASIPDGWILDAGCGAGHSSQIIRERFHRIVGLDRDIVMLRQARMVTPFVTSGSLPLLPFHSRKFTLMLCVGVSEYLSDLHAVFREFGRVGHDNALLLLTSSPFTLFSVLRMLSGPRLFMRRKEDILSIAAAARWQVCGLSTGLSQDVFLFQKTD